MANRLSQQKAEAIASEYVTNGYNQTNALLAVGYKPEYAKQRGKLIMDNVLVKQAINKLITLSNCKTSWNVELLRQEHVRLQQLAEEKGDLATATSNLAFIGKTIAAYSDNLNTTDTTQAKAIDEQAMLEAKIMAEIRLKQGEIKLKQG